jgi:hypothetical protein
MCRAYREKFNAEDLDLLHQVINSRDVLEALQADVKPLQNYESRLVAFSEGIERYSVFISFLGAASPELSALFWGSMDLLRKVLSTFRTIAAEHYVD